MSTAGQRLVPWKPIVASFETLTRGGIPEAAFSKEVLEAVRRATDAHEFSTWDLYLDMNDQAHAWCGSDDRFIRACEAFDQAVPEVRAFVSPGVDVRRFCRFVMSVCDVQVFPGVTNEVREIGDDAMELKMRVPTDSRDASSWLLGNIGALRTMTRHLGLPPAKVEAEIGPHLGRYLMRFPTEVPTARVPEAERLDALENLFTWLRDDLRLAMRRTSAPAANERLDAFSRQWGLTARQREVLDCIRRGMTNKEISAELGCSYRTVELHVTAILQKSDCASRAQLVAAFVVE
jgi:DNA-binding CsgD family transcriptional regulator